MNILDRFLKPNITRMTKNKNIEGLVESLRNKDYKISINAGNGLKYLVEYCTNIHDLPTLRKIAFEFPECSNSAYPRREAIGALAALNDVASVEKLIAYLNVFIYSDNKRYAVIALGKLKDHRAIPTLINYLGVALTSNEASDALASIGAPAVAPLIKVILGAKAIDGTTLKTKEEIAAKFKKLDHLGPKERACHALCHISDPKATPLLIEALQSEDFYIRDCAATALGEIRDGSAIEPLIKILNLDSVVFHYRERSRSGYGEVVDFYTIHPESAVRINSQALYYHMPCAAAALIKLGKPVIPSLKNALEQSDEVSQKWILTILAKLET